MYTQEKKSEFFEKYLKILDDKYEKLIFEKSSSIQHLAYRDLNIEDE